MECKKHDKPTQMLPLSSYFNNMTLGYVCLSCGDIIKDATNIDLFKQLFVKHTPYERQQR